MNLHNHHEPLSIGSLPISTPMRMMSGVSAAALGIRMTPFERAAGRLMRAPDHAAGEGGDGGEGAGGGDGAGAGGEGGEGGANEGGNEGGDGGGGDGGGGEAAGGEGGEGGEGAGDSGTIAGDAVKAKDGEGGDDGASAVLGAPEAYDLKVPEEAAAKGMEFDKEVFDLVEPDLRELNLSNDAAQRLVDAYAGKVVPKLVERGAEQANKAAETRAAEIRREWADEAKKDPEIGGANFDKTVDACAQVWDRFGVKAEGETAAFRKLLNDSGLGNHPDMLRFLSRVAKATGEDSTIPSDGGNKDTRPIWDRVYGTPE